MTITISPARPVAVNDTFSTDALTPITTGNLLANDTDANTGVTLSVATVHDANGNAVPLGTATLLPSGALLTVNADGSFTYDPNGAFNSLGPTASGDRRLHLLVTDSSGRDLGERRPP